MSFFAHFTSEQIWMVLILDESGANHLETWLAPAGRDGVRRIFRHTRQEQMPVAATPLTSLGTLGRQPSGLKHSIKARLQGPEQAVFVIDGSDGASEIINIRGKTPQAALLRSGLGGRAAGAFHMDMVRNHSWTMRRILDNQNFRKADVNLLKGNGLPNHEDLNAESLLLAARPQLWTRQEPGENDE